MMLSDNQQTILFSHIIKILSRYFLPLVIFIGNISCILSLIMFSQKSMRKNSSGLYFLSFTLVNFIFLNTSIITTILFYGFDIDPSGKILIICQMEFYIGFVTSLLSSSFLVLASIDRFITTSSSYNTNRFNTCSTAIKLILALTLFSCIFHIHSFFLTVQPKSSNRSSCCQLQKGTYILFLSWYIFLVYGFLTPILMIIFGTRTVVNVRRVMTTSMNRLHPVDRQFILIMLSQCIIHLIFRLPLPIYFIYDYITAHSTNNIRYHTINQFFFYISLICFYIPFCSGFFVNLVSHSFRAECRRLVKKIYRKKMKQIRKFKRRRNKRVYPMGIVQRRNPNELIVQ